MVILGGWGFLMSEVPLYHVTFGAASERKGNTLKGFRMFTSKPGPESGPDCLICAEFARQRCEDSHVAPGIYCTIWASACSLDEAGSWVT
jgi:hypothetical protein